MSSRHFARAIILQVLFLWDFNDEDTTHLDFFVDYNFREFGNSKLDTTFVRKRVHDIVAHKEFTDDFINRYTKEWHVDRVSVVDRNILRIALYEMFKERDVPTKAALNEAVELAKEYSGASSQKFISGVLGAVYDDYFSSSPAHTSA